MPWRPQHHWLYPAFRLAWAEHRDAARGPSGAPVLERRVCSLRVAWVNPSDRPARYEARFTGADGRPFDDLRFGGVLAPRAAASFDLLGHPALAVNPGGGAGTREGLDRAGWFELLADVGLQAAASQDWLDERPAAGVLCRWSQELRANASAVDAAAAPVEPSDGPAPELWQRFDELLHPAAPPRLRPGDALAAERRRDPRCSVIRRDIELLEHEFESLRDELERTPAARREAVRLLIDAVQSEQRALAAEARAYGCPVVETPATASPAPLASGRFATLG